VLVVRPHGILVTANRAFELFHEDVDPALLAPPVNLFRLALHPDGVAAWVRNLLAWGWHITENLWAQLGRNPDPSLDALLVELEGYLPPLPAPDNVLGFAVPLELSSADGDLRHRRDARRATPRGVPTRRRSYEALVRDQVRFRVGRMVYAAFYHDDTIRSFGFPRDEREALVSSEPDKFLVPRPSDMRYQ